MFAYAGNNPIKYTDPDGRTEKIPVPLTGRIGTLAHNTAYPIVDAAIYLHTGTYPIHNKGMITADGTSSINRKRPDWQSPTGPTLLVWEMKPGHDALLAQKDVAYYIALAMASGVDAEAGPSLGKIAEGVPIQGMENVFLDIYSPSPGVVLYNAYTIKPDFEPVPVTIPETQRKKVVNTVVTVGATAGGIYLAYKLAELIAAAVFAPPLVPVVLITP